MLIEMQIGHRYTISSFLINEPKVHTNEIDVCMNFCEVKLSS